METEGLSAPARSAWLSLNDADLLAQCEVDTYRASGPGGQKRNKTSSAVRVRHKPTGLLAIAEESRSQHDNRKAALRRIRQTFVLELREPLVRDGLTHEAVAAHPDLVRPDPGGPLDVNPKNPRFWPVAGVVLDVLDAVEARVSEAAGLLGVSTGVLNDFLQAEPKLWQAANGLRVAHGQKPLRNT